MSQSNPQEIPEAVDLLVIGGGINGCGIAADAQGRGLSTLLVESQDLASATSQWSSKLAHGGLRYLENFEFRLVQEALSEREHLLQNAPHLVTPLEFYFPYRKQIRPYWLIRIGMFLYSFLDRYKRLPSPRGIKFQVEDRNPLNHTIRKGFSYYDCFMDDARLVLAVAKLAKDKGATIATRTRLANAVRDGDHWKATLETTSGVTHTVNAKALVNVSGPWVNPVLRDCLNLPTRHKTRLVKGSHIVVPRLYRAHRAYILQNIDGRVIFTIPFQKQYTLIGTTETPYEGDGRKIEISPEETEYLLDSVNQYFHHSVKASDIVWSYAGVRPLLDDATESASKVTREYRFDIQHDAEKAPVLSVYGGKLTTYRKLAENAVDALKPYFPDMGGHWTKAASVPGGRLGSGGLPKFEKAMASRYTWLPSNVCARYCRQYGDEIDIMLKGCHSMDDMGVHFGAGLYEKEVRYMIEHEWAHTAEDILWRRSKLGLSIPTTQTAELKTWIENFLEKKSFSSEIKAG